VIAQMGLEDTSTRHGQGLGTASYLAPERALGRPATMASDLYSLAIAAFELLTGERPFSATSYVAQARQHLEQPPPRASERRPSLPRTIDAVLARGMAKAPEQRWPTAEAFAVALERALAPAIEPPAESLNPRAAAVSRGRRALAAYPPSTRTASSRRARPAATEPAPTAVHGRPLAAECRRRSLLCSRRAKPTNDHPEGGPASE